MKLLFNLEVIEGNRIPARPSAYLDSLEPGKQGVAVREFLARAEREAQENSDPRARAEAAIGIVTARQYLDRPEQQTRIITDPHGSRTDD